MTSSTTRRTFLGRLSSILGAAALLPGRLSATSQELAARAIPKTGEQLPIVGLGTSKAVLQIPERGVDAISSVLKRFIELGGRVADTSPRSPDIDERFGAVLQQDEIGDSLFLTAKVNTENREAGVRQFRQTQRLFGRRTLDVVQVESLRGLDDHWNHFLEWRETGEARYIGVTVSNDSAYDRLEQFMRRAPLDFIQVNYSVMETRAEERIVPLAVDRGFAVLTNRPFMNGSYFPRVSDKPLPDWAAEFDCSSWAQFSLKYILANPGVTVALTETTSTDHIEENLLTATGRFPDEVTRRRMRELVQTF